MDRLIVDHRYQFHMIFQLPVTYPGMPGFLCWAWPVTIMCICGLQRLDTPPRPPSKGVSHCHVPYTSTVMVITFFSFFNSAVDSSTDARLIECPNHFYFRSLAIVKKGGCDWPHLFCHQTAGWMMIADWKYRECDGDCPMLPSHTQSLIIVLHNHDCMKTVSRITLLFVFFFFLCVFIVVYIGNFNMSLCEPC